MDSNTGMEGVVYIEPLQTLDMGNYTATAASGDDDDDDKGDDSIPKPRLAALTLFGQCDWLAAWLGLYLLKPAYVGGYAWAMVGSADEEF